MTGWGKTQNHLCWLVGCVLVLASAFHASAQQPPSQSDNFTFRGEPVDLNQWLEKLEKQNADLTRQLQELQKENARLKRLVADQALDNQILREAARPNW